MSDTMLALFSDDGQAYNVRLVREGDRHGRNDCLTHDRADPLVEFYAVSDGAGAGPRGYFVSSYYASTLRGEGPGASRGVADSGLCLHGGGTYDKSYSADASVMTQVLRWLEHQGITKGQDADETQD